MRISLAKEAVATAPPDASLSICRSANEDVVVALAGNPNVGKSTVFNALTGLHQHTGNWPGKTVSGARGAFHRKGREFILIDLPGTYSLSPVSAEEEVSRDFLCFGDCDLTVVVADATCLERNLSLLLQILEVRKNVVLCLNLIDEAEKKKIKIDSAKLSELLGIRVVETSARSKDGLPELVDALSSCPASEIRKLKYSSEVEAALDALTPAVSRLVRDLIDARFVALRLLENDTPFLSRLAAILGFSLIEDEGLRDALISARLILDEAKISDSDLRDMIAGEISKEASFIFSSCVTHNDPGYCRRDRALDRILTSRSTGVPAMLLLLGVVFWITITGANYPSQIISEFLFDMEDKLSHLFSIWSFPEWAHGVFIEGLYRTISWVVSVMLPPMAIFFPLFTLLEDSGYLPRMAFNMDRCFKKARAHGKQCLTMCMGFGCNACAVTGCRIIDSPRERLIAILTNNFVPCNGRFPTLIAMISIFFASGISNPAAASVMSAFFLLLAVVLGVLATLFVSYILSLTVLRGIPSFFTLELPPYRRPQIGKVVVRSVFDRTLFVLGRAVSVAAPAGIAIWILANITVNDVTLLSHITSFLDPFARFFGLDGVILTAFVLAIPANEIFIPLTVMGYLATGSITQIENYSQLLNIFSLNGWTAVTAICVSIFCLMHFPCATTLLTIKKETGSLKWTALAFIIPTVVGLALCALVNGLMHIFGVC